MSGKTPAPIGHSNNLESKTLSVAKNVGENDSGQNAPEVVWFCCSAERASYAFDICTAKRQHK